ncbi:hypothetical protein BIW11_07142 [Tropilaelaps mercedesae]|uniref:Uncharacterized protein n=1 Tax=Tropilaelaps mercedesae TaxID=418985 RepID=A0A1V9XV33_9ACAR|nr:hypothetical protein BIW11_07142 [Tropilaelaps mercedesae]
MSSYADEPLPPGINPDDNKSDDDNEYPSISTLPLPPGTPPSFQTNVTAASITATVKRSDSPYSIGDSLSEPESDEGGPSRSFADDLLPPGVEKGDNKDTIPAPPPLPPPPAFVLDDELCKKLAQRKVKCYFIETMVNLGLPKEAFEALAASPHPNLLCREMVKRHLWPPQPPGAMDDLPHLELFDDPEGPVFPEGLHTLIKRLAPLHDEEGTPLTRLPPGSVPLIEMASRIYGEALQRCRESALSKYRIPSPEYIPPPPQVERPETPPLPPTPQPVPESKKRAKKLLEQKLAARKAQIELNQNTKAFNFSHLVNMRNALRREEKEELALPRDDENSAVPMASILNDDSSQEASDISSNVPALSSPATVMEEGEISSPVKPSRNTTARGSTSKPSKRAAPSPPRLGMVAKRTLSPDEAVDGVVKRKERRRRWDVLPNGVKLDATDQTEVTPSLKEHRSDVVKLETLKKQGGSKGRSTGKEKEQDAESNGSKLGRTTNLKDALRKLSFGTEEEDLEKRREEEKKVAEARRAKELQEEATRLQMEADLKTKELEERQRRKREQQEADRKRLEELEAKRRTREAKEYKAKKDLKTGQYDKVCKSTDKARNVKPHLDGKKTTKQVMDAEIYNRGTSEVETGYIDDVRKESKPVVEKIKYAAQRDIKDGKKYVKAREEENAKMEQLKNSERSERESDSTERDVSDQGSHSAAKSETVDDVSTDSKASGMGYDSNNKKVNDQEKSASMNPRLQELAKAMEVAVGPVAMTQERLLEMVLKTLLKEIQGPHASGTSTTTTTSAETANESASTTEASKATQATGTIVNTVEAAAAEPTVTATLAEKNRHHHKEANTTSDSPKMIAQPETMQLQPTESDKTRRNADVPAEKDIVGEPNLSVNAGNKCGSSAEGCVLATTDEEKSSGSKRDTKKKKKKDSKSRNRRFRGSTESTSDQPPVTKTEAAFFADDEVETVVDRTFKRHLRFPVFGIRVTATEKPLKFSANLAHQTEFIALVDRIRPVESIVSRRTLEPIKTLDHIGSIETNQLSQELDKVRDMDRQGDVDEAEFMEAELIDSGALGMVDLDVDEEGNLSKPVTNTNLIEIKPTPTPTENDGATYTGNLLEVPIVCAAESTSSPSSAGQSSAVSQQDSPESTTGPPKSSTGLTAKPKAARAKSVSFFDGTVPEKDPQVRSPPPPSPSLTERRRSRQGQKVPLLPPATLVLAAQGRKRAGSPPPSPTPPPPPGRPNILYVENPITHQLYQVMHPGNGIVMTPGGLADVRADSANHKYIYAEVEGAEAAGPVLVENFMPRVHLFPYLLQTMTNVGALLGNSI